MQVEIALEFGAKKTFASAIAWPGWSRSGRDEAAAIEALVAYAPRYERALGGHGFDFEAPDNVTVVERLTGNATTDYGAPDVPPSADLQPVSNAEMEWLLTVLSASWDAFSRSVNAASGKELQRGPRGGGRDVAKMVEHVLNAHYNYLRRIFWREKQPASAHLANALDLYKDADVKAMTFAISGEMPERGSRGNQLWKPRYFVRRAAWHILDHAWEIEDKVIA